MINLIPILVISINLIYTSDINLGLHFVPQEVVLHQ